MIFSISGTKRTSVIDRSPYYRGVRKERLRLYSFIHLLNNWGLMITWKPEIKYKRL